MVDEKNKKKIDLFQKIKIKNYQLVMIKRKQQYGEK